MNDLFGLSMTYIMIALLVILGGAVSTILWVIVRQRVMFLIGVRNIPRRRAQTVLIIIGLMLSTLIISTAFSIGDTVNYSLTNLVYERLQGIDEVIHTRTDQTDTGGDSSLATTKPIPGDTARSLVSEIKAMPGVDGALPVIRTIVPVLDARTRLNEPQSGIIGADPASMQGFESGLQTLDGNDASLGSLAPNEIYVDKSLADKLDILKGDTLQIFVNSQPHDYVVKDIVKDRVLGGTLLEDTRGLTMTLSQAQTLLGRPDDADLIFVSNTGGVRDSLGNSGAIKDALNARLDGTNWSADATKADLVDTASTAASFLTTFFVVLGLFSIAAGALLIFLIFVMLAAERKVEMGMIRAVGTKRQHLVQMFMSEGMAYNVGAAAVGCALGVVVSIGMVRVMASLFGGSGGSLGITFHVTPRSLIVSYSLGVVLTFLTVTFSSWRIGNLNIVSAIRDTADPTAQVERPVVRPGILGALSFVIWIFFKPRSWKTWFIDLGLFALAAALIFATVMLFVAAFAVYGSNSVAGVIAVLLGVAAICAAVLAVVAIGLGLNRIFQTGAMALIVGAALVVIGLISWQGAAYAAGISLLFIGAALTLVMLRVPARPVFTTMGLSLLLYWLLGAGGHIPPHMDGGIEMFFLSGIIMVLSATFVLIYNADLMLGVLTRIGNLNARWVPSIRTAVAYPLANKFRTGMTIAMISLVMFALVMMSTMNSNFSRIFLSNEALGGYDVVVRENPHNAVPDLKAALQQAGGDASAIAADDTIGIANPILSEARIAPAATPEGATGANPTATPAGSDFSRYNMIKPSPGFLQDNGVKFHARADGYSTDAQVWNALATQPDLAVIDGFAVGGGGFGGGSGFTLSGIKATDTTFAPIKVQIRDAANPGNVHTVTIIGIFTTKASAIYQGLYLSPAAFTDVFPKTEYSAHFVKLTPGTDSKKEAKYIESTLSAGGVQGDSLRQLIDDAQAQNRSFFYLIQGFMGIGLFVGIAAVGVIAFRTVVERRQQIGMMRALGYTRRAVAWSFIMESSFIALLGILSGISLGILLAYQLLQGDSFAGGAIDSFYVPWMEISIFGGFAFIASFLMTIIPSRQASSIPIAEALRYE
jgi:putative ABC transport system permease protein